MIFMSLKHLAQSSFMGMLEDLNKRIVTKYQNKIFRKGLHMRSMKSTTGIQQKDWLPAKAVMLKWCSVTYYYACVSQVGVGGGIFV